MIVHHAHGLHVRIADRRAHKLESASQQILAHRIGLRGFWRHLLHCAPFVLDRLTSDESPNVSIERSEFLPHLEAALRILNCRGDLQSVPHDAGIAQKTLDIALAISRYFFSAKPVKSPPIGLSFPQNRRPTQARLRSLEDQHFKKKPIIMV